MISLVSRAVAVIALSVSSFGAFAEGNIKDLSIFVRTNYPSHLETVDDYFRYVLHGSGYNVYDGRNAPIDASLILGKEVKPQLEKRLVSRRDALLLILGEQYSIVVDEPNRLVSVTESMEIFK